MMRSLWLPLALLLVAAPALATPNFPGAIQRTLGAAKEPACGVCHAGGVTGRGTVTTALGQAMMARGLAAGDEATLARALAALEADRVDSNANGVIDVEELRAGRDPSLSGDTPQLEFGCAVAAGRDGPAGAGLLVLLVGALLLRSRLSAAPSRRWRA